MRKGKVFFLGLLLILCSHGAVFGGDLDQWECVGDKAYQELGVRELTGNNDGWAVERYLATTGLKGGYAWCAAFINWTMVNCGVETPEAAAWSPSWFTDHVIYHRGVLVSGDRGYHRPDRADVFGIYFTSKNRVAHVGMVWVWNAGNNFVTIEGNTNEAGSREGDGVYRKYRLKSQVYQVARWVD